MIYNSFLRLVPIAKIVICNAEKIHLHSVEDVAKVLKVPCNDLKVSLVKELIQVIFLKI